MEVSGSSEAASLNEGCIPQVSQGTAGNSRIRHKNGAEQKGQLLQFTQSELLKLKCVNSAVQDCRSLTLKEGCLKWLHGHHVGATMEITLDKNGSLYDPVGTES